MITMRFYGQSHMINHMRARSIRQNTDSHPLDGPELNLIEMGQRNERLQWRDIHTFIVGTVMALGEHLPAYVLLWIIDALPYMAKAHGELKKITLITSVVASIHRVVSKRPQRRSTRVRARR
jgi:hypothetical protein